MSTEGHHVFCRGPCALRSGGTPGTLRPGEDYRPWRAPDQEGGALGRGSWDLGSSGSGPDSRSFRPVGGPGPPRSRRRCARSHRVDTLLDDGDVLLLALDNVEHGVGLIGEVARRRDADRLSDQVAGRDAKGRILPQLVKASRPENDSGSAPRADPELSNADWSDARFSFRWISLAGAVLHVIRDGTPMVVSRLVA